MNFKSTFLGILFSVIALMGCSRDEGGSAATPENKCGKVSSVIFQTSPSSVTLNYVSGNNANSFKIEYGLTGFAQGSGKKITTSNTYAEITDLLPSTTYDFYITGICSSTENSEPYKLTSVTTQQSSCNGTVSAEFYQYDPNQIILQVGYSGGSFYYHEVEFGPAGFALGSGTRIKGENYANNLYFNNLPQNQTYDFYVRTFCSAGDPTAFKKYSYNAVPTCPKPFNLNSYVISGQCNVGMGATRGFSWSSYGSPQSYTVSLIQNVNDPPGGQEFTTSNTSIAISNMYCLWKGFYVRSNCSGSTGSSAWAGPFIF
ncbi:fibronectin type III domain-containing protein [Chryseobacterium koreense]|uniref:Fibronectin type-III domain-containing protein n=1 Tax=Chryseobacterium koreense CCUG 49689 TaxID=1304281 RepID=A0A0J7J2M5_9FLAO|nr:fibronectin type III domain-containing protein [Chryseobacterium koreense]KMQ72309.1 hypothetical protein ACM44_02370 [Chryseobacterium koreense CCUG 49689]MBB5333999.1 hypothetical protein [Chryseobacterium koreense]